MKLFEQTFAQLSTKYGRRAAEPLGPFLGIGRSGGLGTSFASTTSSSGSMILTSCLVAVLVVVVLVVAVLVLPILKLAKPLVLATLP